MSSAGEKGYEVRLSRRADTYLSGLDKPTKENIVKHLKKLQKDPLVRGMDIKPISGPEDEYRLRVGSYRVVYSVDKENRLILVSTIRTRGDVYKR